MITSIQRRITSAHAIAIIALIFALCSTAFAAATITGAMVVDGSLTGADIATASIPGGDIAGSAITSSKIASNAVTYLDIATGAVRSSEIRNGTVTAEDLSTADIGDGLDISEGKLMASGSQYPNVITVAATGGDFDDIQDAIDSISNAANGNRYLVWVAPGVYSGRVTSKEYVDITGASRTGTKLTAAGDADATLAYTVKAVDNTDISNVTIINTGGDEEAVGVYASDGSAHLHDVTVESSGANQAATGVFCGNDCAITISDSIVTADEIAIFNNGTSPIIRNVEIHAGPGGNAYGIYNLGPSSPLIERVRIDAVGGATGTFGISNSDSSPTIRNSTITVIGTAGGDAVGVFGLDASNFDIYHSEITASGGDESHGLQSTGGVALVRAFWTKSVGSTSAASTEMGVMHFAGSMLGGDTLGGGTFVCATTTEINITELDSSCNVV